MREMFYGLVAGQFVISLGFLAGRLLDGMPFYEAFGKFWLAFLLGTFLCLVAFGLAAVIDYIFFSRNGRK